TLSGVTDQGAGRYTATLTSGTATGTATVSGTVNTLAIGNNALVPFTAGAAAKYLVTSTSTTPVAGSSVTISAQLADANNNSVATAGQTVTWASTGGGSFGAATSTTNSSGVATVTFTTNSSATTHTVTATTGGLTGTSAAINAVAGSASSYAVTPATTSPLAGA